MADYFIDFTEGSNGDGSSGTPWNQFTTSEHTTVSGGDYLWFRRCDTTKLIDFIDLAVDYVGWPKSGDPLYSSRPAAKQAAWDPDTDDYCVQYTNVSSVWTMEPYSDNTIHRFYGEYAFLANTGSAGSMHILNKQDIEFNNCKFSSWNGTYNAAGWTIFIDTCSNIVFNSCIIHDMLQHTTASYRYPTTYKITNSTGIYINDSTELLGMASDIDGTLTIATSASINRYALISNSTCYFYNHEFTSYSGYLAQQYNYNYRAIGIEDSSVVTYSGSSFNFLNTYTLSASTVTRHAGGAHFRCDDATLNIYNSSLNLVSKDTTFIDSSDDAIVNVDELNIEQIKQGGDYFILIRDCVSVSLTSISGTLEDIDPQEKTRPMFMMIPGLDFIEDNVTINNINLTGPVGVLDITHNIDADPSTATDVVINSTSSLFSEITNITYYTRVFNSLYIDNVTLHSIVYIYNTYNASYWFEGTSKNRIYTMNIKECTFNSANQSIYALYTAIGVPFALYINMYGCTGGGNIITIDNLVKMIYLDIYSKYNTNFSAFTNEFTHKYNIVSLNDSFVTNNMAVQTHNETNNTSVVTRTGGAGFSNYVTSNTQAKAGYFQFPKLGQDNLWVSLPSAGTYTVTAYILHSGATPLSNNTDVEMVIEKFEGVYLPSSSSGLSSDSSTWTPEPADSTAYVLTASVTVAYAQFVPVHFLFHDVSSVHKYYIDPKLVVT